MIDQGLIDEVKNVVSKYDHFPTAMQGLGYKEVVEYLDGKISKEEMIDKIKQETRRYAKRQLTWFRKNKEIIWIDGLDKREKILILFLIILKIRMKGMIFNWRNKRNSLEMLLQKYF